MATLQVLTLNVWGLWLVSKKRYNRILHLAEFLANDSEDKHKLDLVLLQEVWVDSDAEVLMSAAKLGGLPYAIHFRSGVFGSGLLTLSRYPITQCSFHQYMAAGDPMSISCGDYLAAKGVGWIRVDSPAGPLDVFNTHLHANYSHKYDKGTATGAEGTAGGGDATIPEAATDDYAAFRMAQVLELSRFVGHTAKAGSVGCVLGGDLNCKPDTLETAMLQALLPGLLDSWSAVHGPAEAGHTCKATGNSFQPKRQQPSRIDYVMSTLQPQDCAVTLQRTPQGHSFSDHCAVHATLRLPAPGTPAPPPSTLPPAAPQAAAGTAGGRRQGHAAAALARAQQYHSQLDRLLASAHEVLGTGAQAAVQAAQMHQLFAFMMFAQGLGLCVAKPLFSWWGVALNPVVLLLLPLAVLLLGVGAGALLLVGLVADCGQARALMQALEQVEVEQVARATVGQGKEQGQGAGRAAEAKAGGAGK